MYKKNLLTKVLIIIGMLFATTSAFAIPKDPCDQPKDVCCEEPPAGPFAFSYPRDVGLSCPRDFYVHAEFLLMKGSEEGLDYAMDQDAASAHTFPLEIGKVRGFSSESQEWDWRPGFRVGFGFFTNHDSWNFDANWTYFRIKADSEQENIAEALLGLYLPPAGVSYNLERASARWSGDFNTLDLMIGKPYHVSRCYISNPMFGVRAAWIDQDYHIRYFINTLKQNLFAKNDYWAVGLRGYYEGDFLLGSGWFLYGKAAFALLFGKFDTSQHSDIEAASPLLSFLKYKTEDSFYCVQPNAELGMGISWSKFFHKNQYKVAVKVGYEFHHWWDQNQMRKFFSADPVANDTVSRGDLSFNGFMVGLHIDF